MSRAHGGCLGTGSRRRTRQAAIVCGAVSYTHLIGLHEGRKRQVRRMLAAIGHPVLALHRDTFGPVGLGGLPRGAWRVLEPAEVHALERAVGR